MLLLTGLRRCSLGRSCVLQTDTAQVNMISCRWAPIFDADGLVEHMATEDSEQLDE
jgi:hypothetical protein